MLEAKDRELAARRRGAQPLPTDVPSETQAAEAAPSEAIEKEDWSEVDQALDAAVAADKKLKPAYSATLLPDGARVIASFTGAEEGNVGGATKWFALFEIIDVPKFPELAQEFRGAPILRSYNRPKHPRLSPQHALAIDWTSITGLKPVPIPSGAKPNAFLSNFLRGVQVEARTHRVTHRMDRISRKWIQTDAALHYSVIDLLEARVAGSPRVLQRRSQKS